MKREIRDERNKLKRNSIRLRTLTWEEDLPDETIKKIRKKQDVEYKKIVFYDNLIKANERIKKNV